MLSDIIDLGDTKENVLSTYSSETSSNSSAAMMPSPLTLINDFACLDVISNKLNAKITNSSGIKKSEFPAELVILEQPIDKFRFRYLSEMHGTHGSLLGLNSKRTPKTFPEVELRNFSGFGVIRCSIYQADLDNPSPHPHLLVVRREDKYDFDPHDLFVSPEKGYVAQFQNMGIIQTAKKHILDTLLKKKMIVYKFVNGLDNVPYKIKQELQWEAEAETRSMNTNQIRLRFDAYKIENNKWIQIAEPVYSNPISNRKSAQTGDLRICRLSSFVGSVNGGEELMMLVEKVSKKNIQVRFFEVNDDEEIIWESYGKFRESDVHHQYAIVVQTPPYKNRDIDKNVTVFIELVRPSDDERSDPVEYRYKPRDVMLSRKRRRICSNTTTSSNSFGSSGELPEPIGQNFNFNHIQGDDTKMDYNQTISEEFNKDLHLNDFLQEVERNSGDLKEYCDQYSFLELDGPSAAAPSNQINPQQQQKQQQQPIVKNTTLSHTTVKNPILNEIFTLYDKAIKEKNLNTNFNNLKKQIRDLFEKFSSTSDTGDSIIHDIIIRGTPKDFMKILKIIEALQLIDIIPLSVNFDGENPLHCACLYNKGEYIRPLFSLGFNLNKQDNNGNTPFHIAIRENDKVCLDYFEKILPCNNDIGRIPIDVNLFNDDGYTPLHMAIRKNNVDLAIAIMRYNNSSAEIINSKNGNNALHMAVLQQNPAMVEAVLKYGLIKNINAVNRSGNTALDLAKSVDINKRKEIIQMILENGVELENVVIKEELLENDSESSQDADDDEDDDNGRISLCDKLDIKKEIFPDLSCLLNPTIMSKLVEQLSIDERWTKLAKILKKSHLINIWKSAEEMLNYLRDAVQFDTLHKALLEVDPVAAQILFESL